jgi:signal transduction histidine kinase
VDVAAAQLGPAQAESGAASYQVPAGRLASIRTRLGWLLVGISVAWGLAISATIWLVGRNQVDKMLDYTLLEAAEILYGLLNFDVTQLPMQGESTMASPLVHEERLMWQVVDESGHIILKSHRAANKPISTTRRLGYFDVGDDVRILGVVLRVNDEVSDFRVFGMALRDERHTLYVAHWGVDRQQANLSAVQSTALVVLLSGVVVALLLRAQVRRELTPLNDLSASVAVYDPLIPNARLVQPTRTELIPLRQAVFDFGTRLARRVSNERAFTAHAAHALRTPLAGMDAQLAAALKECAPEQQPRLERTREAARRLHSVVEALLTLFRSGVDLKPQEIEFSELIYQLPIEALELEVTSGAVIWADMNLLAAGLLNLFDNSIRHGATKVQVDVHIEGPMTRIRLKDNGPGIPQAKAQIIQDALNAQDYAHHMGLGLMLADLIARAHQGRLTLLQTDNGVTVEMSLRDMRFVGAV